MVRLILRSCKADRPHPDSIAEAILWVVGVWALRPADVG
jgi:hypothetical protein